MKKFIFALSLGLAVPAVSFADIATGPAFSYGPVILGLIILALIVGIVLIVKHFKKRNVNLPR